MQSVTQWRHWDGVGRNIGTKDKLQCCELSLSEAHPLYEPVCSEPVCLSAMQDIYTYSTGAQRTNAQLHVREMLSLYHSSWNLFPCSVFARTGSSPWSSYLPREVAGPERSPSGLTSSPTSLHWLALPLVTLQSSVLVLYLWGRRKRAVD